MRPPAAWPVIDWAWAIIIGAVGGSRADNGAGGKSANDAGRDSSAACLSLLRCGNRCKAKRRSSRDSGKGLGHGVPLFLSVPVVTNDGALGFLRIDAIGKRAVWRAGSVFSREYPLNESFGNALQINWKALNFGQIGAFSGVHAW